MPFGNLKVIDKYCIKVLIVVHENSFQVIMHGREGGSCFFSVVQGDIGEVMKLYSHCPQQYTRAQVCEADMSRSGEEIMQK